jgi:hypothetical protein
VENDPKYRICTTSIPCDIHVQWCSGRGGGSGGRSPLLKFHVDLGGLAPPPHIFCTLHINLNNVKNTHKNICKRSRTFFRIPSHFQSSFNTIMSFVILYLIALFIQSCAVANWLLKPNCPVLSDLNSISRAIATRGAGGCSPPPPIIC